MTDESPSETDSPPNSDSASVDAARLRLEQARYHADVLKWVVAALGAVVSFAVIDFGKLRLEQFRATAENQRELLNAYLRATESPEPEVWKRKLKLIATSTNDEKTTKWAKVELKRIGDFAAKDALYRETLKVASRLVDPNGLSGPDRVQARARFDQLYWADLPYVGEDRDVETAMVSFRRQLIITENAAADATGRHEWDKLDVSLFDLSKVLRNSTPKDESFDPAGEGINSIAQP